MGQLIKPFKTSDFSEDQRGRLSALAEARGESEEEVLARFGAREIARCPRSISNHIAALRRIDIAEAGTRDGVAYLKLEGGPLLYGYVSHPRAQREYRYLHDTLPSALCAETYLLGLDVAGRYSSPYAWPPAEIAPPRGGVVVEAGAYLGHKSTAFVDRLIGPEGKMLAIEMMPDNCAMLRRNVSENGLADIVDVRECGVWRESGVRQVKGKGRQRNSLTDIANLDADTGHAAPVETLDHLIAEWGQSRVDMLYVSVNGAELDVLEGLQAAFERVRAFFIVAPYMRDGKRGADRCREILAARGCHVLTNTPINQAVAWGPGYGPVLIDT